LGWKSVSRLTPRISMTVNGFTLEFCEGAYGEVVRKPISASSRETAMKTLITVLSLAALANTSAMAQAPKVKAVRANSAHIYESDDQGNQTFPNPDRDFGGAYFYSRDF